MLKIFHRKAYIVRLRQIIQATYYNIYKFVQQQQGIHHYHLKSCMTKAQLQKYIAFNLNNIFQSGQ